MSQYPDEIDLTTPQGVVVYLAPTPFACAKAEPLSGGWANFIFRLHLITPYQGRSTLILKHARPYAARIPELSIPVSRQVRKRFQSDGVLLHLFEPPTETTHSRVVSRRSHGNPFQDSEVDALRRVRAHFPPDAPVTVPTVHHFDGAQHAIVMDDAGPRAMPLKAALLAGRISPSRGAALGKALGEFLRTLHARGRDDDGVGGLREKSNFEGGNVLGRELSVFCTYGRLGSTLRALDPGGAGGANGEGEGESKSEDSDRALLRSVLGDEPLGVSEDTLRVVEALAERRTAQIMEPTTDGTDATFVMGDFWPGNILVVVGGEEDGDANEQEEQGKGQQQPCFVVDWELAKAGLAGLDAGQLCAELTTLRRLRPDERAEAAGETLASFVRAYFAGDVGPRWEETRRVAVGHFGAHLAVFTARTGWDGGAGPTRALVLDGVARLVEGADADRVWTDDELVQTFLR